MIPNTSHPDQPFAIRRAEQRDGVAIAAVHRASMREAMPWLPDLHTPEEDRAWVAQVVLPRQEVWVAEVAGQVVGVASMDAADMLTQLYILPEYQGAGIGSALLETAKAARPDGFGLYAFQRNMRARQFYERRGFVPVAFGDGTGNEEGEPDVLYRWAPGERDQAAGTAWSRPAARHGAREECGPSGSKPIMRHGSGR